MKKISFFINVLVITVLASCTTQQPESSISVEEQKKLDSVENKSIHLQQAVLWQQNAAEYKALCYQAYNNAKNQLKELLKNDTLKGEKLAIITDIDETVLDNSPFEAKLIHTNTTYTSEKWKNWVDLAQAEPVPGALDFLNFVKENNVEVFYVSNRKERGKAATLKNLNELNFPFADTNHIFLKTTTSSKKDRFNKVRKTHTVLLYIGDNLSDYTSLFRANSTERRAELADSLQTHFGKRFIVLPNPMYGDWQSHGLFKDKHDWTKAEKDSIIKNHLYGY